MIYTVTFNPAIDYVVRMSSELLPGMTNRSDSEECYFGGKGINVSTILKNLGLENTALGFTAGFTGKAIAESVNSKGILADFIELPEGISRINVKIKGQAETEINAQGPKIPQEAQDKLFDGQIEPPVLCKQGEHVVQKAAARGDLAFARAVQRKR